LVLIGNMGIYRWVLVFLRRLDRGQSKAPV
jgi:hypothetical protein